MQIPFAAIDLFLAHDQAAVARRILEGIGEIISQIMPVTQKALGIVQKMFGQFKVVISSSGFSLQATPDSGAQDLVEQLFFALRDMAALAESQHQKVILFIDEFQDIAAVEGSKALQGAIRHVAQQASHVVFVFSGSSRHMLLNLFDDSSKPLYLLCDKIELERMCAADCVPYIQEAALAHWQQLVGEDVMQKIVQLTELHPFYVSLLCHTLCQNEVVPQVEDVVDAWRLCFERERRRLMVEVSRLSKNQQILLSALALDPVSAPTGQAFLARSGLSMSSVRQALKSLPEQDVVWRVESELLSEMKLGEYRVLDPLLAYALRYYRSAG